MPIPECPKIYHIVHIDKLPSIVREGCLWCDSEVIQRGLGGTTIGMGSLKQRRLQMPVACHPGTCVGDYVPFYFAPRSVMLYLLHRSNHGELAYHDGQGPIVHLEADLNGAIGWAEESSRCWAFTLSNAAAFYTQFHTDREGLVDIDWDAVAARDWRQQDVKERKQAEFLVQQSFPWSQVSRIGVYSAQIYAQVLSVLQQSSHRPQVEVLRDWYY